MNFLENCNFAKLKSQYGSVKNIVFISINYWWHLLQIEHKFGKIWILKKRQKNVK